MLGAGNTKLNRAEFLSARYSPASGTFNILGQIFQSSFYGMLMGSLLKGSENPRLKIIAVLCAKHSSKCFIYINSFNPHYRYHYPHFTDEQTQRG